MTLEGKVVVVAGGSRGIGRGCVLGAAALGARVVFCSRGDEGERVAVERAAAALGGWARGLRADVSREETVSDLFAYAHDQAGPVTSVICSAAISRESMAVTMPTSDWDDVFATNLTGSFIVSRAAVRVFLDRGTGGRIVLMGTLSQNGVAGNSAYAASKGGVLGLARTLARQYAPHGIVTNVVIPGYVETALSSTLSASARRALIDGCPLRRSASPDEIASVAAFLLSDAAAGISGQAIGATGGMLETPL